MDKSMKKYYEENLVKEKTKLELADIGYKIKAHELGKSLSMCQMCVVNDNPDRTIVLSVKQKIKDMGIYTEALENLESAVEYSKDKVDSILKEEKQVEEEIRARQILGVDGGNE